MVTPKILYQNLFNARINAYFGGRAPISEWRPNLEALNDLSAILTGKNLLTEQDFEVHRTLLFLKRDLDFQPFVNNDGEANLNVRATYFEPCDAIPSDTIGYGIELIVRGTEQAVERGFDTAVKHLGYPLRVEVPSVTIPFDEYHYQTTNIKGWLIAKRIIKENGAQLSAKVSNSHIYRFPYNLLFWYVEGKVVKDGKVIDPMWNENVLGLAVARGQAQSVITID